MPQQFSVSADPGEIWLHQNLVMYASSVLACGRYNFLSNFFLLFGHLQSLRLLAFEVLEPVARFFGIALTTAALAGAVLRFREHDGEQVTFGLAGF
jgi:hypothetical protein